MGVILLSFHIFYLPGCSVKLVVDTEILKILKMAENGEKMLDSPLTAATELDII